MAKSCFRDAVKNVKAKGKKGAPKKGGFKAAAKHAFGKMGDKPNPFGKDDVGNPFDKFKKGK